MPTGRHRPYKERKYTIGQRLLTLRTKIKLTQAELATQANVHRRSIQNWETSAAYPREDGLQSLIAVFLAQGAFTPGSEQAEAQALWEEVSQDAPRPLALFDAAWFAGLLASQGLPPAADTAQAAPATSPLPTGLVTFLATDIEGSTQRWEHAPQAMQQALARHHTIIRQLAALYHGQVLHVAGDGFICVFADSPGALQSALAIQRAFLAEPWPESIAPLRVRMALHSGAASTSPEGYIAEPTLNRLSRVLTAGQGGQILLTQATVDLIGPAWPSGVTLHDLGLAQLRDVTTPLQLWQALAPDLASADDRRHASGQIGDRRQETEADRPDHLVTLSSGHLVTPSPAHPFTRSSPLLDWGEAIDVPSLYGRSTELATLVEWVLTDRCRVVALLGLGGIGKTSLAIGFARQIAVQFEVVIFRSLRNAPPIGSLLDNLIQVVSGHQATPPERVADKIELLVALLRERRCLLILDNAETLMQGDTQAGQFEPGYADYGRLIARLGETQHQSCLLLTSREKPTELGPLEGRKSPVRTLLLRGLNEPACRAVLDDRELFGAENDWVALAQMYGGNPLALKLVSEPIRELFGGDIAAFLHEGDAFFNGVGQLLETQFARSTPIEQSLLLWLAIARDLALLDALLADLAGTASQREVLQALESLRRRSLIERAEGRPAFTLQPVVLEYLTTRIVEAATAELIAGQFQLLCSHALLQAMAKEYVRQSQLRMLVVPVLERLRVHYRSDTQLAAVLHQHLETLRTMTPEQQGYGGGNLAMLLAQLQGHLRGANLSSLALWNVSFAGLAMQDADLRESRFHRAALTDTLDVFFDAAASADNQYFAAAMTNGIVRIWRAADLVAVADCIGHATPVWAIAFRPGPPSGAKPGTAALASGGFDGTVRLWAVPEGTNLGALVGHRGYVWDVAWHPGGATLASAGEDGTLRLWDVATGAQQRVLAPEGAGAAYALAWHPDGTSLASGHADGSIRLWAAADPADLLQEHTVLRGHSGPVWALAWSPDGTTLASASADASIRLWDDRLEERAVLQGHTGLILGLAWHPGGRLLASAGADTSVRLWDAADGRAHAVLDGHSGSVGGVAFSADGTALVSSAEDQTVRIWDMPGGQPRATLVGYSQWTFAVAWSADGRLASAGSDRVVQSWDLQPASEAGGPAPRLRAALAGHSNWVHSLAFSPDGRQLASGAGDGTVRLWEMESGRARLALHGHDSFAAMAWSADGRLLASAGANRAIMIWDADSGARMHTLEGHDETIWSVAWRPGAGPAWLASAGNDRTIMIWDADSGARMHTLEGHSSFVRCVAWHPGGRLLASCSADGSVRLWDAASGEMLAILLGHSNDVREVAWHPDGRLLASGSEDGSIRLWELADPQAFAWAGAADTPGAGGVWPGALPGLADRVAERAVLRSDTGQVRAVAWGPGGAWLASGGEGGWIVLWDVATALSGAPARISQFRSDRPYERMHIGGASGLAEAQRATLVALGALED